MLKGIYLTLLMGPSALAPAPSVIVDALDSVEVTTTADSDSAFQLSFQFNSQSPLNQILIAGAQNATLTTPALRVLLMVTMNGQAQPLIDGVMTHVAVQPGSKGGSGTLLMTGDDLTRMMDNIDHTGQPYPSMSIEARVAQICAKYSSLGIVSLVQPIPYPETPVPNDEIPIHQGTDLEYLRQMAREVGHVFYVQSGTTPGSSVAYFGPEIKTGMPQPALNVDMDAYTNIESLNFEFDSSKGIQPLTSVQLPATDQNPQPISMPSANPLQPPLGQLPTPLTRSERFSDTAKLKPQQALARNVARAARSQDSVSARGELDVLRYGNILQARRLVGVRGAGVAHDGLYYVRSVTSTLKRGSFKQSFELSRNGLVSTIQQVPV